jgi:hypothetical protein
MTRLLSSIARIAMLRNDPGTLPASMTLAALLAIAYAAANTLLAFANGDDRILPRAALDLGFTLAFFWLVLALTSRRQRFAQTMSALFGAYVLLAPLMALLLAGRAPSTPGDSFLVFTNVASTFVVAWYLLIVAHILKSALDTLLVTGFVIAIAWVLASATLAATVFPGTA